MLGNSLGIKGHFIKRSCLLGLPSGIVLWIFGRQNDSLYLLEQQSSDGGDTEMYNRSGGRWGSQFQSESVVYETSMRNPSGGMR